MAKDAECIAVYGARGMGKSTLVKALARGDRRVIVFDVMEEYPGVVVHTPLDLLRAIRDGWDDGYRIAYRPVRGSDREQQLSDLSLLLCEVQDPMRPNVPPDRHITLIVEEMSVGFPNRQQPSGREGFKELANMGRHYGIKVIGTTQRPADIGPSFRSNANKTCIFRLNYETDYQTVGSMIGREHIANLKTLPVHEYLLFEAGTVTKQANTEISYSL